MLQKKWIVSMSLIASLALMTGCSAADEPGAPAEASAPAAEGAPSEAADPTPDVSGIPEIIAEVNGEKITKADFIRIYEGQFPQMVQQAQLSGQELDQAQLRAQTAEGLVNTELLIQQAKKKKIFATAKDLDQALADVAKTNGMNSKEFLASMDKQGLNEDAVRIQLKTQLEVGRLISREVGDFKPTDKELKDAYQVVLEQYKGQGTAEAKAPEAPTFKKIKPELEQQLKLQKEGAAVKDYVAVLRKDAKVTTNM
ncbi:SurA N-terminal domain-containing protein [Paeniglutamicibacter sp. ABSL32-1]|uniref:SurA N-terminal domain-containing protein n=1 Tax=Paeniglutamicibacter quisquiliarum TaxID=2849498 RepID=UPI001C2D0A78|nr:SurA N-terminal domain-containing protein [Paeniglutamicibacter quisquiliarum]MBV1778048.1 SurA N-terminal domain-containing protein [Paeniglutamicibacter quisquiliarum]